MNGGSEQRRSGREQSGDKTACFGCGNTDRFNAQCLILISKTKRWASTQPPSTKQGEKERNADRAKKGKGESFRYTFLDAHENDIGNDTIPESQVNVATRKVNISDSLRGSDRES